MSNVLDTGSRKRRPYAVLGNRLRDARSQLRDDVSGRMPRVEDMATKLSVTPGFVYQVEGGWKKPKDGALAMWASVYGVRYVELCKALNRIPMDLVASLKDEIPDAVDPFSQLSEQEKAELLPFLTYVRWKLSQRTSPSNEQGSVV